MADKPVDDTLTFYDGGVAEAEVTVKSFDHGEYQVVFRVGVQHFDIGPRYDVEKEAQWMLSQFCHALGMFSGIMDQIKVSDMDAKVVQSARECGCPVGAEEKCVDILCPRK